MPEGLARAVAEAYRWQRRLGNSVLALQHCHVVSNSAFPDVWDANHVDAVSAESSAEIDAVMQAMDSAFPHTRWRVAHTDRFTPDAFLARLALEDFTERPVTIQMVLQGGVSERGAAVDLRPVETAADWQALLGLVLLNFAEGRSTGDLDMSPEFTASMVASYRAKGADYRFHLAMRDGAPIAYGAYAAAPNGIGVIEDLFTLPSARRAGIATGMIADFVERLRDAGSGAVFLGALAGERPKHLYARLGFRPLMLARAWVKELPAATGDFPPPSEPPNRPALSP